MNQRASKGRGRGRRPGETRTREAILAAARRQFSASGYDGTTIRAVAAEAEVDPALVHHYFAGKGGLFTASIESPVNPADVVARVIDGPREDLGERLVRSLLELWEDETPAPILAMLRSAAGPEEAVTMLREFISREVVGRIARGIDADHAELRATLCGSQVVGLAMVRYVVRVEPLASAGREQVVAWIGPTIQRYLTGPPPDGLR